MAVTGDELERSVVQALQGDGRAFATLIELSHARVYRLALYLMGDAAEAEDVTQEVYIRAWSRLEGLRQPAAVLPWLSRITRNVARDRLRWWKRRRVARDGNDRAPPLAEPPASAQPLPSEALLAAELGEAVRRATRALPEKLRVCLLLREVEGMSYEEIARLLEVPLGTAESRVHRARQALARRLERLVRPGDER